jgi:signal transduction histidine kinase
MTDYLRSLSHEIRQPLTVMRAETEQALRMSQCDENYRELLSGQLQRVELLSHTMSDLLEMATSEEEVKLHPGPEDPGRPFRTGAGRRRWHAIEA